MIMSKQYIKEVCCQCCGAPICIRHSSKEEFEKATSKGKSTHNFTEDELEEFYGVTDNDIAGVVYDSTSTCNTCTSYSY